MNLLKGSCLLLTCNTEATLHFVCEAMAQVNAPVTVTTKGIWMQTRQLCCRWDRNGLRLLCQPHSCFVKEHFLEGLMARNLAPFLVRQLCNAFCEAILFSALLYQCVTFKRSVVFVWSSRLVWHLAVWWLDRACPMAQFACFPENNPGALLRTQLLDWLTKSGRPFRTQRRFCGLAQKCYQSTVLSAPCFSVFIVQLYITFQLCVHHISCCQYLKTVHFDLCDLKCISKMNGAFGEKHLVI